MPNIINKSNHPVEVKRVEVRVWKVRDEIETAISERISELNSKQEEVITDPSKIEIDDIKEFYQRFLSGDFISDSKDEENSDKRNGQEESDTPTEDSNLDSSGNEMDADALAMAAALAGDDGDDEKEAEDEKEEEEDPPKDDEAESEDSKDDEAARMAAEMLGDQAPTAPEPTEMDAQAMVDSLTDSVLAPEKDEQPKKEFVRPRPADEKTSPGFVLLADIQMDQVMIFTKKTYIQGQSIVIEFLTPKSFSILAEVITSINIARKSKIISTTKPDFRIQCRFQFKYPGDRGELRSFLQSVEPTIPDPPRKLKKPEGEEDDDDFNDLGF